MTEENQLIPEIVENGIVAQLTRGEVDQQVTTAKRYPRSIKEFKQGALSMAIKTPETAQSCFYSLPRGGKKIEGPSIRLAEIVAVTWGNLRCETRVIGTDAKTVTAQATAWDMQRNVLVRCESSRRITDRSGKRYNDDMIVMTGNAAASIALRNAIFKVVPMAYVSEIYEECRRVAASQNGGIDTAKQQWFSYFAKLGVKQGQLLEALGKDGLDDVDLEDITTLQGLCTALQEGQTTIEEVFRPEPMQDGTQSFGFKGRKAKTAEKPKRPRRQSKKTKAPDGDEPPIPPDAEAEPPPEEDPWARHLPPEEG